MTENRKKKRAANRPHFIKITKYLMSNTNKYVQISFYLSKNLSILSLITIKRLIMCLMFRSARMTFIEHKSKGTHPL